MASLRKWGSLVREIPFHAGLPNPMFKNFVLYCKSRAFEGFNTGVWQEDSELCS